MKHKSDHNCQSLIMLAIFVMLAFAVGSAYIEKGWRGSSNPISLVEVMKEEPRLPQP